MRPLFRVLVYPPSSSIPHSLSSVCRSKRPLGVSQSKKGKRRRKLLVTGASRYDTELWAGIPGGGGGKGADMVQDITRTSHCFYLPFIQ